MPTTTTETITLHGQVPFQSLGLPTTESWSADFVRDRDGVPQSNLIRVTFAEPFVDLPTVVVSVNHDLSTVEEMAAVVDPPKVQLVQVRPGSFTVTTGEAGTANFNYHSCTFTFVAIGEFQSTINT